MSKPVAVYLLMIAILIGGLWAVLAVGRTLSVPEDLAGKWQLVPTTKGPESASLLIEQSGRFFQLGFEHGPHLDLKLVEESSTSVRLMNGHWQVIIDGVQGGDEKSIELTGEQTGHWTAHRIIRTFPADVSAKEGH